MVERIIVAIGALSNLLDLQVGCFGTLSKLIKQGSKVFLAIAHESSQKSSKKNRQLEGLIQKSAETIGVSGLYFTTRFDYSRMCQDNVNVLRSFIESSHASVAIIPFTRTNDPKQHVLAESSLLACRSITNILMYSYTKPNTEFIPNLISRIPKDCLSLKDLCISAFGDYYSKYPVESMIGKRFKKKESSPGSSAHHDFKTNSKYFESFAIHRLVLLSSNQILE
jgi:hypothetical protein